MPEPYRTTVLLRYERGLSAAAHRRRAGDPRRHRALALQEAISRLRAGLEARCAGDRRDWQRALFPLGGAAAPATTWTGAWLMATKTKLGVAGALALLVVVVGGLFGWRALRSEARPGAGGGNPAASVRRPGPRPPRAVAQAWQRSESGQRGSLAGVVLDGDGRPAPGALVALVAATAYEDIEDQAGLSPRATTFTGTAGAFRFEQVPPGLYLLTATWRGWAAAERADVPLLPGEALTGLELRLGRGGARLSGRVWDRGGGPIAGPVLRALALSAGGRPEGARTFVAAGDGEGRYEVLLPRGSYRLVMDAAGYVPASEKALMLGDRTQDFRLAPAGRLSGRVVDGDGAPVAGARVPIASEAAIMRPSRAALARATTSDGQGRFAFAGLPAGSFRLEGRAGP